MKEKNFQTEFSKRNTIKGVFELKLSKGCSIRFDSVKEHQVSALLSAQSDKGLFHKISDSLPIFGGNKHMRFTAKKPFDCFLIENYPAYVVVMFYTPRKRKNVYYIPIDTWLSLKKNSDKKSIREEELKPNSIIRNYYEKTYN